MNIRRYYVPNAVVFITQVVWHRQPIFAQEQHLDLLRATLHEVQKLHPFLMLAYVFLPDHFHLLIRLRDGVTFSDVMHSLKPNFTKEYKIASGITGSMRFWQKRFWDHVIRDEMDFEHHMHYIHYNPVRHGLVQRPEDWPHSSLHTLQERGVYPPRWGWSLPDALDGAEWLEGAE